MSNPNNHGFDKGKDDSGDDSPSESPAVSTPSLEFLLKSDKQAKDDEVQTKKSEEESSEEDTTSEKDDVAAPKRSRVGRALRSLLKRRRNTLGPAPVAAEASSSEGPGNTEEEQPLKETSAEGNRLEANEPEPSAEEVPEPDMPEESEVKIDHPDESKPEEEKTDSIFDQLRTTAESPVQKEAPAEELPADDNPPNSPPPPPVPPVRNRRSFANQPPFPPVPPVMNIAQPAAANVAPGNTTIIEKDRGITGHLVTLFAANYLSKRRDRKLKRQDRKLEKAQKEIVAKADTDRSKVRELDSRQRSESISQQQRLRRIERTAEQRTVPETKPVESPKEESSPSSKTERENSSTEIQIEKAADVKVSPVKVSEVLAVSEYAKGRETKEVIPADKKPEQERDLREFYAAEARRHAKDTNDEHQELLRLQSRESIDESDVRESVFERRHEIKDEAASTKAIVPFDDSQASSRSNGGQGSGDNSNRRLQGQLASAKESVQQAAEMVRNDDEYREALRNGILIGTGTVVLGLIAYLIT